jgi:hypothetical protein
MRSLATPRDPRSVARREITAETEEPVHDKAKLPWPEKPGGRKSASRRVHLLGAPLHRPPPVPDAGPPARPGAARDAGQDAALRFQGKRFHRDAAYVLDFVRKQQDLHEALADGRQHGERIPWLTGDASGR